MAKMDDYILRQAAPNVQGACKYLPPPLFSFAVQCTEAGNNARRLIFVIWRSFQDLKKSAFIPLSGALVLPYLAFGMPAFSLNLAGINRFDRIQRFDTSLVTAIRHLP